MKNQLIIVFLTLITSLCYSQTKAEVEVFKKIINHEIKNGGIFIQCNKSKTYFNSIDFKKQTGLDIPYKVLKELEQSSKNSKSGIWESELFANLNYGLDFIKSKDCLSKKDSKQLFEKTGKRQSIVLISEPIFDKKNVHSVVSITYWKFNGSLYGKKYFLKKVYGLWTIIVTYEIWMT